MRLVHVRRRHRPAAAPDVHEAPHRRDQQSRSIDRRDLGGFFERLATPGTPRPEHGIYAGAPYVDGQLFARPARVHLEPDEVAQLREASSFDWRRVEPAIFGFLLEGALGRERQWRFGAHYTSETDIMKVVGPTVLDPWLERLESCETLEDVQAAQGDLSRFRVLDPACGSGNFLYVAYRELRRIEGRFAELERRLRADRGLEARGRTGLFTLESLYGIDNEPFAIRLARVTLWMGHALAVRELDLAEEVLPLPRLPGIRFADALKVEWPLVDAIIGNPPYHGSQQLRHELGDEYADWLSREFGIGLKDYAVYWFRKAHDALPAGGRAGFVATNSVSQGRSREVSLKWVVESGGVITNAVSKQPWPGAAAVNVIIVNWVKNPIAPPATFSLDATPVGGITAALRPTGHDISTAPRLRQNAGRAFQGPMPVGRGFVLAPAEARQLLSRTDAAYEQVVRPFLVGDDIANQPQQLPSRYVIDFAVRPLEDAARYPAALEILRRRVKKEREANRDPFRREHWWLLGRPVLAMRSALKGLDRYIAGIAQGKRILFCWCDPVVCPSNLTNVFAFDDDYSMGILSTSMHHEWARDQSSTLEDRFRYTPTSAFETFPWPQPSAEQREAIAEASRAVIERRQAICLERQIGLTRLYNEVDDGAYRDLKELHRRLDESVAAAYGWPRSAAHDPGDSNRRLLERNRAIAAGEVEYRPFT